MDSTINYNQAIGGCQRTGTTQGETGGGIGGGIANFPGSTLTLLDSTVSGNVARGGSSNAGVGGIAQGGGIQNLSAIVTITGSTVADNQAIGGNGGSGFEGGLASGGGLQTSAYPGAPSLSIPPGGPATATVIDSTFSGNQVIGGNGGSGANGGNAVGGGINLGYPLVVVGLTDTSSLTLTGSSLDSNLAQGGNGGNGGGDGGDGLGGGLAVQTGAMPQSASAASRTTRPSAAPRGPGAAMAKGWAAVSMTSGRSPPMS